MAANSFITPVLYTKEIQDPYSRTNFLNLSNYFSAQNQLLNYKFFEIIETGAVTNKTLAHGLGFAPKDIFRTLFTGTGYFTWQRSQFTNANLVYSTTGPIRLRFYVGTAPNDTSTASSAAADTETYPAVATAPATTASSPTVVLNTTPFAIIVNDKNGAETGLLPGAAGNVVTSVGGAWVSQAPATPLQYFWTGYHDNASTSNLWTTTSASYVDPASISSANVFVSVLNVNMGTVSGLGANSGSSAQPGIVFTPPSVGGYEITATITLNSTADGTQFGTRLVDGSNNLIGSSPLVFTQSGNQTYVPITLIGFVNATSLSAITAKIQIFTFANSCFLAGGSSLVTGARAINWTIKRI